jgi:hypothetical protein
MGVGSLVGVAAGVGEPGFEVGVTIGVLVGTAVGGAGRISTGADVALACVGTDSRVGRSLA